MTRHLDLIHWLSRARVLVVGDLMLDCFVRGEIEDTTAVNSGLARFTNGTF